MSATNPNDQYEFFKYIRLTEDGRLIVSAEGVVNDTFVTAGFIDVPNSELVLNRSDGNEVRIDAAEFLSDAFVTEGTYDPNTQTITFTNNLGGTFVVDGFELSTTASNGLTEVGNDVQLGGTLTKDTIIEGDGTQEFLLGNVNSITIASQDDMLIGGGVETEIRGGENGLRLDSFKSDPTQIGAEYTSDYTVNWNVTTPDRMLPTKGYVDREIANATPDTIYTADGLLTGDRILDTDGNDLLFTDSSNNTTLIDYSEFSGQRVLNLGGKFDNSDPVFLTKVYGSSRVWIDNGTGESLRLEPGSAILQSASSQTIVRTADEELVMNANDGIKLESDLGSIEIVNRNTDVTQRGAFYESDYTVNWDGTTPDSMLTTKGYVDRAISDNVTASNGLTEVGGDIQLGGILTQDTNIQSNTELFTITADNGTSNTQFYLNSDDGVAFYINSPTETFTMETSAGYLDIVGSREIKLDISGGAKLTLDKTDAKLTATDKVLIERSGLNSIQLYDSFGINTIELSTDGNVEVYADSIFNVVSDNINLNSPNIQINDQSADPTQRGAEYITDYTLSWDATTPDSFLTTKGYVDREIANATPDTIYTADGLLTGDRIVDTNGNQFKLTNSVDGETIIDYVDFKGQKALSIGGSLGSNIDQINNVLLNAEGFIGINVGDGSSGSAIRLTPNSITLSNDDILIDGTNEVEIRTNQNIEIFNSNADTTQRGAKYGSDYTLNWDATTPDSMLTTKGYVDREIANATPDTIYTADGLLTGDRIVDTNGNQFKLTNSVDGKTIIDYVDFKGEKILLIGGEISGVNQINNVLLQSDVFLGLNSGDGSGGSSISIYPDSVSINNDVVTLSGTTRTDIGSNTDIRLINNNSDTTQRGAKYFRDYTTDWDDTTLDEMLPTKGYVDRKSLYNIGLGRNGNVNSNAYLRGSGNVIHNAGRGELITMDSKLEKLTYRVNNTNGTGGFDTYNLVIRHMNFNGVLLNETVLTLAPVGIAQELNLTPALLGWDGEVSGLQMVAIQFRPQPGSSITTLNNVQATIQMSIK